VQPQLASSKLDLLAGKLLESSGLLSSPFVTRHIQRGRKRQLQERRFDQQQPQQTTEDSADDTDDATTTTKFGYHYLSALERILDITHPVANDIVPPVTEEVSSSSSSNLFTCTDSAASNSFSATTTGSNNGREGITSSSVSSSLSMPDKFWSPPPLQTGTTTTTATTTDNGDINDDTDDTDDGEYSNMTIPSLEEVAPLSPTFYNYMGYFMICAYNPSAFKTETKSATTTGGTAKNNTTTTNPSSPSNNMTQRQQSRPRIRRLGTQSSDETKPKRIAQCRVLSLDIDAIRATKILRALMELNVLGGVLMSMDDGVGGLVGGGERRRRFYRYHHHRSSTSASSMDGASGSSGGETTRKRKSDGTDSTNDDDPTTNDGESKDDVVVTTDNDHHHQGNEEDEDDYNINRPSDPDITFLDILLYYTEGNDNIDVVTSSTTDAQLQQQQQSRQENKKKILVPLLHSIFKHMASLPQLEGQVLSMARQYRTDAPPPSLPSSADSANNTTNNNISTSTATATKIRHMNASQTYRQHLTHELDTHISTLETLIGSVYERSDVAVRKRARVKLGGAFQNFILVDGSGGMSGMSGGGNVGAFGVENTCAAGMECLLNILRRILRGIPLVTRCSTSITDGDDEDGSKDDTKIATTSLQESHHQLLFEILLPLHRPSGMVLWRDQTPLLGLYH